MSSKRIILLRTTLIAVSVLAVAVPAAQAILYAPGETLNPACAPSDPNCGVRSASGSGTVSQGTTGQFPYYAANGDVLTATSTFSILSNGHVGVGTANPSTALEVVGDIVSKGTSWTGHPSATEGNAWFSVTYGNGLYVAVANSGTNLVMTSPDGINWTSRVSATEGSGWHSVTYGNGLFVAVATIGTNRVMTSPDGITWTARTSANELSNWSAVAYGNGLFVAVATNGTDRVMTSPDGITWTARTSASPANRWTAVTYANGLFVAVAFDGANLVMTSPDGINWTPHTSSGELNAWESVTYGNGLFVAVAEGGTNVIMTSPDGANWTPHAGPDEVNDAWNGVTYGDGLFVAVSFGGVGNRVMTSPDGFNWTPRPSSNDNNPWISVTYGNGVFVAVADTGTNQVMTSGRSESNLVYTNHNYQGGLNVFGDVGIGTSSPAQALDVVGTIRQSGCITPGTLSVNSAGDVICTPSSLRFKDNIVSINTGLPEIVQLRPVAYNFKPELEMGAETRYGFIAEEVASVTPEFATYDSDGLPYGLDTNAILAASVNAIKELSLEVQRLGGTAVSAPRVLANSVANNLGQLGDYSFAFFSDVVKNVSNGVAYMSGLVVDTLTVGTSAKPVGVTIYDTVTSEPRCISSENGVLVNNVGECGSLVLTAQSTAGAISITTASTSTTLGATSTPLLPNTGSAPGARSPAAFTRTLDIGSTGSDVTALQILLQQKGFLNTSALMPLGYYGERTRAAVMSYQRSVGLPAIGVVNLATRDKLNAELAR